MSPLCQSYSQSVRPIGKDLVVRIIGRLPTDGSWMGEEAILDLVERLGQGRLYLDFSNIAFLGSAVISCLIRLHARVTGAGGRLVLWGLRPGVEEIFNTLRLGHLFDLSKGGPPGGSPALPDPAWLTWQGGAVRKAAQDIYTKCRFSDLPTLADALEEAGCTDADILAHCRRPGEHVKECWVVELLLGKT